jgi:hypothetical protein
MPLLEAVIPCKAEQCCKIAKYLVCSIASPVYLEPFNKDIKRNPSLASDINMIKNQQDL